MTRLRPLGVLIVALVALAMLPAGAQESIDDARSDRDRNRQEQRQVAAEINELEADRAEIRSVLEEMDVIVDAQIAEVDAARQRLVAVDAEAAVLRQQLEEIEAEQAALERLTVDLAIQSYMGGDGVDADLWFQAEDVDLAARRDALLGQVQGDLTEALDRVAVLAADQTVLTDRANASVAEAEELRRQVAADASVLESDRARQLELEDALVSQIDGFEQDRRQLDAEEQQLTDFIRDRQLATVVASSGLSTTSAQGFVRPIDANPGSPFGNRRHPILGIYRLHAGVDFGAPSGTPIWAAKEGTVISAGWRGGYGRTVLVEHDGGVVTLYAHMSRISASVGSFVGRGEIVGFVGSTGQSTGPHLHFETRINGTPKDPMLLID